MISSVIPARLEYSCGHAALVSLPRLKGETPTQRTERVSREKMEARGRACDFCGPREQALLEVRPVPDAVPSGEVNGHHAGDEKENLMHAETPSVTRLGAEETRRTFPPRRRLNEEQEREVTRLYVETAMPVPEISKQFSIGESSVYRIAQRHGAGLRGRIAPSPSTPAAVAPKARRVSPRAKAAAPVAPAAKSPTNGRRRPRAAAAPATATPVRGRRAGAVVTRRAALRAVVAPAAKSTRTRRQPARMVAGAGLQRFEIHFRAETVLQAADVSAALRQVESLGATDVIAIVRQDR